MEVVFIDKLGAFANKDVFVEYGALYGAALFNYKPVGKAVRVAVGQVVKVVAHYVGVGDFCAFFYDASLAYNAV